MGWGRLVFEFNKITGSAAAKPFTIPIFTSYPLLEEKRLELPRQEESSRWRNTSRSPRSCARPGRNSGSQGANFTAALAGSQLYGWKGTCCGRESGHRIWEFR